MTARGEFASNGLAGKVRAASRYAAEHGIEADDLAILRVAWTAHDRGVHPGEVWREVAADGE